MTTLGELMLTIACPHCGAAPGRRCRQPDGKRLATGHSARQRAAEGLR